MLDAALCTISFKLKDDETVVKALVTFKQDGARISGFRLKDGPHGLWLEPPKMRFGQHWPAMYFDENKERYAALQREVVRRYAEEVGNSGDIIPGAPYNPDTEINLDDIAF